MTARWERLGWYSGRFQEAPVRARERQDAPSSPAPIRIGVCFLDRAPGGGWIHRPVWLEPGELAARWVRVELGPEGPRRRVWVRQAGGTGWIYKETKHG